MSNEITNSNTAPVISTFSHKVNGRIEIVPPKFNDPNPFEVELDGKIRKVYTTNQAIEVIGLVGDNARNQLQQMIQKMQILKVGEAYRQGTMSVIGLLDAGTVLAKKAKYTPRGSNSSTEPAHEIRISPEFLVKFIETEPKDLTEEQLITIQQILAGAKNVTAERTKYHRTRNATKAAEKFAGK